MRQRGVDLHPEQSIEPGWRERHGRPGRHSFPINGLREDSRGDAGATEGDITVMRMSLSLFVAPLSPPVSLWYQKKVAPVARVAPQ